jgi:hypothetical protein
MAMDAAFDLILAVAPPADNIRTDTSSLGNMPSPNLLLATLAGSVVSVVNIIVVS